ncbi:MAG: hypothetical protein LPJ89_00990 [Hymenobacteraceae bacterium]|nr:hypothetical protein [Hymenobacteraceae bacterium]MDX5442338.1 hypothetical protein [Hymenobacteraceae bacterium]
MLQRAEIAHVVVWYCEDDGKEYRLVLPRLFLEKEAKVVEAFGNDKTSQVFENL